MQLDLRCAEAANFSSRSQQARVMSESWCKRNMFCVACKSERLVPTPTNTKAVDFFCHQCDEPYQLKSGSRIGPRVPDGAYSTMVRAIRADEAPNLLLLAYSREQFVHNLWVVPRFFFSESALECRPPLASTARRAGWIGCNILLNRISEDGKICIVNNGEVRQKEQVRKDFSKSLTIGALDPSLRGWTLDVLTVLRNLEKTTFSLSDVYRQESELHELHPKNKHVRPKIRQQLQVLRDFGILNFVGKGEYSFTKSWLPNGQ